MGSLESRMVCESCQSKVSKICVPDKWKDGARNVVGSGSNSLKAGKTNKALAASSVSAQWIPNRFVIMLKMAGFP